MKEIYLDNAATTPCDPDVAQVALEMMTQEYGNPSSLHQKGFAAQQRLEKARQQIASVLGCLPEEVLFTASGTEANNLAVLGAAAVRRRKGGEVIALSTLHASLLRPLELLSTQGFSLQLINPDRTGHVNVEEILSAISDKTTMLVLEHVNSEVGAVVPVGEICKQVRRINPEIHIHCDAVQGFGKLGFVAKRWGVDSLTVSGHKLFAPKGCGALYLRKGVRVLPLIVGGGQERGLRPGTENTPAICAFGYAGQKAAAQLEQRLQTVSGIREHFVNKAKNMPQVCMNSPQQATPYISNLSVPGIRSETMLHFLAEKGIYISSGSACGKGKPSPVLTAMGLPRQRIDSALRISLSPYNTIEEIDQFFVALQEGIDTLARSAI